MEGEDPSVLLAPHHVTAPIDGRELQRLRSSISDIARSHPDGLMSVKLPDEFDSTKTLRIKSKGFITSEGVGD